jgi:anti-sigma regulatory factor (Ser/Thr protein kinase)
MADAFDLVPLGCPPSDQAMVVELDLELPAAHHSVAEVRRLVRSSVDGRFSSDRIDDIVLAASELATNAVEHAGAPTFRVSLRRLPLAILLAVHSAASDELDLSRLLRPDALADPTALRGRGLGIVRAIADGFDVGSVDGELTVCCRFHHG